MKRHSLCIHIAFYLALLETGSSEAGQLVLIQTSGSLDIGIEDSM